MTASVLADRISCDRKHAQRDAQANGGAEADLKEEQSGRSPFYSDPDYRQGEEALLAVVPAAAGLQNLMLAPLRKEDRAHFLQCMLAIATSLALGRRRMNRARCRLRRTARHADATCPL